LIKLIGFAIIIGLFIASFIIHMPIEVQENIFGAKILSEPVYSDIVNGHYVANLIEQCKYVDNPRISITWFNRTLLKRYCRDHDIYPYPYIDYKYREPSLSTALWIVLTYITYKATPLIYGSEYSLSSFKGLTIFYIIFSITMLFIVLLTYHYLLKIMMKLNINEWFYHLFSLLSSSLMIYMIYSWDIVALLFITLALYSLLDKKFFNAMFFIGLFASFNPIGFILVFLILYMVLSNGFGKPRDLLGLFLGLSSYIVLVVIKPDSVLNIFTWFMNDPCSNCLYLIFIHDYWSQILKALCVGVYVSMISLYVGLTPREHSDIHLYSYMVIMLTLSTVLNLAYPPQSTLLYLPLLTPLYTMLKGRKTLILHQAIDALNALIIILWFKDYELRRQLSFLTIPLEYNPYSLESPIQWIAQTRNILAIIVAITLAWRYLKPIETKPDKNI